MGHCIHDFWNGRGRLLFLWVASLCMALSISLFVLLSVFLVEHLEIINDTPIFQYLIASMVFIAVTFETLMIGFIATYTRSTKVYICFVPVFIVLSAAITIFALVLIQASQIVDFQLMSPIQGVVKDFEAVTFNLCCANEGFGLTVPPCKKGTLAHELCIKNFGLESLVSPDLCEALEETLFDDVPLVGNFSIFAGACADGLATGFVENFNSLVVNEITVPALLAGFLSGFCIILVILSFFMLCYVESFKTQLQEQINRFQAGSKKVFLRPKTNRKLPTILPPTALMNPFGTSNVNNALDKEETNRIPPPPGMENELKSKLKKRKLLLEPPPLPPRTHSDEDLPPPCPQVGSDESIIGNKTPDYEYDSDDDLYSEDGEKLPNF